MLLIFCAVIFVVSGRRKLRSVRLRLRHDAGHHARPLGVGDGNDGAGDHLHGGRSCNRLPLAVLMTFSKWLKKIVLPLLDIMQTMPAYVYLVPAIAFFSISNTSGVFATVVFALPPIVRMTVLGIENHAEGSAGVFRSIRGDTE